VCLVVLWLGLAVTSGMAVEQDEQPIERQAATMLPPEMVTGPHHRVQASVVAYGYMDRFTVDAPFGNFEVVGDGALRKLLNELRAIAALREIKTSQVFTRSMSSSRTSRLSGSGLSISSGYRTWVSRRTWSRAIWITLLSHRVTTLSWSRPWRAWEARQGATSFCK
jgi:hypothetical protein